MSTPVPAYPLPVTFRVTMTETQATLLARVCREINMHDLRDFSAAYKLSHEQVQETIGSLMLVFMALTKAGVKL